MMQATETGTGNGAMSGGYAMSGQCRLLRRVIGKSRTQRGMWSFTVVMRNPLRKNRPQMPLVERHHPIETLAPCCSDEALTMRVRLRRTHWRRQHLERHQLKGLVHGRREDAIAIMDEKTIPAIQRQTVPELLDRPFRRGVIGEIPLHDPAGADVEEDEDVQPLKGGRHHDEEVAGEDGAGMIAQERGPRLG